MIEEFVSCVTQHRVLTERVAVFSDKAKYAGPSSRFLEALQEQTRLRAEVWSYREPVLEFAAGSVPATALLQEFFSGFDEPSKTAPLDVTLALWPEVLDALGRIGTRGRKPGDVQEKPGGKTRLRGAPEAAYRCHERAMSVHPDLKGFAEIYAFIELNANGEFKEWADNFPSTFEGFKRAMGTANKHYRTPVNKSPSDRPHGSSIADKNKL